MIKHPQMTHKNLHNRGDITMYDMILGDPRKKIFLLIYDSWSVGTIRRMCLLIERRISNYFFYSLKKYENYVRNVSPRDSSLVLMMC